MSVKIIYASYYNMLQVRNIEDPLPLLAEFPGRFRDMELR